MFRSTAWPAALGFLLGTGVIVVVQSNVPPGGERLQPDGMALILAVAAALGALIGALAKRFRGSGGDEES